MPFSVKTRSGLSRMMSSQICWMYSSSICRILAKSSSLLISMSVCRHTASVTYSTTSVWQKMQQRVTQHIVPGSPPSCTPENSPAGWSGGFWSYVSSSGVSHLCSPSLLSAHMSPQWSHLEPGIMRNDGQGSSNHFLRFHILKWAVRSEKQQETVW